MTERGRRDGAARRRLLLAVFAQPFQDTNVALAGVFGRNDGDPEGLKAIAEGDGCTSSSSRRTASSSASTRSCSCTTSATCSRAVDQVTHVVVHGSEHQQSMKTRGDSLIINPGEACGWINGAPTAAVLDLDTKT